MVIRQLVAIEWGYVNKMDFRYCDIQFLQIQLHFSRGTVAAIKVNWSSYSYAGVSYWIKLPYGGSDGY